MATAAFPALSMVSRRQATGSDPIQRELEISYDEFLDLRAHMKGVREFDQKTFAKMDVTPAQARTMSSEALISQTLKAGLFVTYMLYDNETIGVYRASLTAPSLIELCRRRDLGSAFAAAYRHMELDPKRDPKYKTDGGPMKLAATDSLVAYPPIRRKLAGHEREVIFAMSGALSRAVKVNANYKPGKEPYGRFSATVKAAARLLEQANPSQKVDLSRYRSPNVAMTEIVRRAKTLKS